MMTDATISTITNKTLQETLKYKEFKTAGTKGLSNCQIKSIILPLLADHVLREANHYLRVLKDQVNK
jgi:phosphoribosylaminoimidazole-succinocarboxamide synthase